jgi:predicted double-glycine peptidase
MSYLDATNDLYKNAALTPDVGLCCTTTQFGNFRFRNSMIMQEMNYGCGSTISAKI